MISTLTVSGSDHCTIIRCMSTGISPERTLPQIESDAMVVVKPCSALHHVFNGGDKDRLAKFNLTKTDQNTFLRLFSYPELLYPTNHI